MSNLKIKGLGASPGIIKGKVRKIADINDMKKIEKNDIIVTHFLTPNMVTLFTRIAAIVTDIGGMTCHAASLAREISVPCVVGTKNATEILNDDELIEVNGYQGTVTIIAETSNISP